MTVFSRKRSSCASGSGYVPSCSTGFCVANTVNRGSSGRDVPSTVTCRSPIASSSADWVFAGARLISSPRRICVNTGPGWNSKPRAGSRCMETPVTSDGMRSGVNWMRVKRRPSALASVRTSSVFAVPGTPSISRCPRARNATSASSMAASWPTMRVPTDARTCRRSSAPCSMERLMSDPREGEFELFERRADRRELAAGERRAQRLPDERDVARRAAARRAARGRGTRRRRRRRPVRTRAARRDGAARRARAAPWPIAWRRPARRRGRARRRAPAATAARCVPGRAAGSGAAPPRAAG